MFPLGVFRYWPSSKKATSWFKSVKQLAKSSVLLVVDYALPIWYPLAI